MSFVLRFFHAPHITSVREAVTWADDRSRAQTGNNPHFARFVESITEFYPDLSGHDDEEPEYDRNLWPEGLESDEHDGEVVNILINADLLDDGVMTVIAQHADAAGLLVLDEQSGMLFGPGPRYIEMADPTPKPLPPISNFAYSAMTENLRGLRFDRARTTIAEACQGALGPEFTVAEGRTASFVRRDHGDLRQMLSVQVMRSTDKVSARVYCRLGFACSALTKQWMPLLPESFVKRRENYDLSAAGTDFEFSWYLRDLTSGPLPADLSFATDSRMRFANALQLQTLVDGTGLWARGTLLRFLDGVRSVDDLVPLFINEASLHNARAGRMGFPIYPALLALAQRAGGDALEDFAAAYRANPDLKRLCTLFKDPSGSHFDGLVEGLRKQGAKRG